MTHGRRRRRPHHRLLAVTLGSVLVVGVLVLLTLVFPPPFLSSSVDRPSSDAGKSVPPIQDTPAARIAIAGDTGTRDAAEAATAKRMDLESQDEPYDALLLLGDLVYEEGDSSLTRRSVIEPFAPILQDATLIPVLGNHDIRSDEEEEILSELGRDSPWYVERVGPLRVVVLDSNQVDNVQQTEWLRGVLSEQQAPGTWTVVAMHHAAYSAGLHGSDEDIQEAWVPLFAEEDIPLVLSGHDHDYQRSFPQSGVTYVVSGAGAKLRRTGREDFTAVSTSTLHYVDLLVYEDRLEARAIDQQGSLIDRFTIKR